MATDLDSTEVGRLVLLRDLSTGTHTRGAPHMGCRTHVHTEDSKSLPSPAHPPVWQGWRWCPWQVDGDRGKEVPPFHVLKGEGT